MSIQERDQKILQIFKDNNLHYEWGWNLGGNLEVEVMHGDWRHDHLFLRHVMRENGYEEVDLRYIGPPTGDDSYSAVHVFAVAKEAG